MSRFYPFEMERMMSRLEQVVDYNLSESGVHPVTLEALLEDEPGAMEALLHTEINYPHVNGDPELRDNIVNEAMAFFGDAPRKDDITMVIGRIV